MLSNLFIYELVIYQIACSTYYHDVHIYLWHGAHLTVLEGVSLVESVFIGLTKVVLSSLRVID